MATGFEKLVERVCAVDPAAADYLTGDAIRSIRAGFSEADTLLGSMRWGYTPRGHGYWAAIAIQLGEF